ncbi:MAG: T9SS C-terminal target domain-containing protein [Chlorobiota bacterium]|nr:MAG: T9SS C-terminal target domain-containing protein [Chlorobiota bacterium]
MKSNLLKSSMLGIIIPLIISSISFSQYKDRLSQVRDLVNSNELIMIWSQGENSTNQFCYQRIYDLDLTHPGGVDSTLRKKSLQIDSSITGRKTIAVATGNFLNKNCKNIVAAWESGDNTVRISVPEIDSATLSWSNTNELTLSGLASYQKNKIHVETGNFFGNLQDEFIVAFQGADTTIHLQLCSFNPDDLDPNLQGSINDETTFTASLFLNNFDIVSGDFNSDGYDDIALMFLKPVGSNNWALWITIYTIDDNGNFVRKSSQEVFQEPAYNVTEVNIDGITGSFDSDSEEEAAFGFSFFQGEEPGNDTYVYLIDISDNLDVLTIDDTKRVARNVVGPNEMPQMNVGAGDFDKNNHDELVLMSGSTFYVYAIDSDLNTQYKSQQNVSTEGSNFYSDAFLAVDDMDLDRSSEIVVVKSFIDNEPGGLQHFEMHVFSLDTTLTTYTLKARRLFEEPISSNFNERKYAIALGDFDGDRVRLGDPVHYRRSGVMQPTVVLYTPPIHYDILNGTTHDLSDCYPDQNCGFTSTYIQSTTTDTTITTEVHEDWGGDASITSSQLILKEKVKATYGDKFSAKESSGTSYTITTGRVAAGDDWIYSNVYDIDFYEYPVYDGVDPAPIGYFLVTIPQNARPLWIELRDDDLLGSQFKPDHETGNVLSYRSSNTFDTSRVIVDFPEQTIGSTGNSFVSLLISSFRENSIDTSWDAGLEVGATLDLSGDFGGFEAGVEVEVNGHYNYGEMYTQTVRVQQSLEVRGDLGHLDPQYGTSGTYYVKPYAYWTSYGALALDYKVTQLPSGGNSFWQNNYGGKTDLAFSLPWRYDPEKGYPLPGNDTTYRYRSRDIFLSKINPKGGDSVYIMAKVRNFGLQNITSPFTLKFYDGIPNNGGNLIAETTVDTTIAARGYRNVFVPWLIPLNQPMNNLRIYVVIDQENAVTNEVHENNNLGWAPAIGYGSIVSVEVEQTIPEDYFLYQSYPNPFNPSTTIKYSIPNGDNVSLKIFDILGREVEVLVDEYKNAGTYSVEFNASRFASGVYFYQLQSGRFIETKKMILLR